MEVLMREIEYKAHCSNVDSVISYLNKVAGNAEKVDKKDQYFRRGNEKFPDFRVRNNSGKIEVTAKRDGKEYLNKDGENNLEYELHLEETDFDYVINFFTLIGFDKYFVKEKKGYEWNYKGKHIELLLVKNLGWFLEIEALVPFIFTEKEIDNTQKEIKEIFTECGISLNEIEKKTYREMLENKDGV